ncbi:MAG TPA: sulfatase [Candidatus Sumerlaeota bacterium]|nr:sulfatase [Candidatus Sumerlaeota bacterium]
MNRRDLLKRLGIGATTLALAGCSQPGLSLFSRRKRPNFVFFLVDDLGWADVGCYGSTFCETPNTDRLAASGVRFTDAYAAAPVCSPTRASIMTGRYPARLNITDWIPGDNPKNKRLLGPPDLDALPLEEVTVAEALKKSGYATYFVGKWHLGDEGHSPENQGFDTNIGGTHLGQPANGYYVPYKNPKLPDGPPGEYLTDRLASETIRCITDHVKNRPDQPFLAFHCFYTVHQPIQPCKKHLDRFRAKAATLPKRNPDSIFRKEHEAITRIRQDNPAYASMVYSMDENLGRVLDTLKELGIDNETVVFFTSDNGGLSTQLRGQAPTSNLPLRAGKGWLYEGGIREPLIVRAPGLTRGGGVCSTPVVSTDFFPTILDLAGLSLQPRLHRDGVSLKPLLRGESTLSRKAIFWHFPHYHSSGWTPGGAVRAGEWKLIEFYEPGTVELYNLRDDMGEQLNQAQTFPQIVEELRTLLHNWQREVGAKMPLPNPDYKPEIGRNIP